MSYIPLAPTYTVLRTSDSSETADHFANTAFGKDHPIYNMVLEQDLGRLRLVRIVTFISCSPLKHL